MVHPGLLGGRFQPLTETEIERIHDTALTLLDEIGMANPIPILKEKAISVGCKLNEQGRLCFPRALVEDVIAAAPRNMVLYGRDARHDIEYQGTRVHFGASGEAVRLLDPNTGSVPPLDSTRYLRLRPIGRFFGAHSRLLAMDDCDRS